MDVALVVVAIVGIIIVAVIFYSIGQRTDFFGQRKRCPECAERVKGQAKICKQCGYEFIPRRQPQ